MGVRVGVGVGAGVRVGVRSEGWSGGRGRGRGQEAAGECCSVYTGLITREHGTAVCSAAQHGG